MQVKKHSAGIFTDFPVPPPPAATWLDCWVDCVTMNETGDLVWEQVRNGTNANTVLVALVTPLPKLAINRDARRL